MMLERDRYVTFAGLDCDANASRIVALLRERIATLSDDNRWRSYYTTKFNEQLRLGVDDLFFVGSQMNTIYEFFSEYHDGEAGALLYQVEQECC